MTSLLYSTVTFDPATTLYTYAYAVQNDGSSGPIQNVDIFVGGAPKTPLGMIAIQPIPPASTSPSGWWNMSGAVAGSIAAPPYAMNGGFYEWYSGGGTNSVQSNQTLFGFSFTTPFAPTLNQGLNDFFLYSSTQGIVAFGNVEVPSGANWFMQQIQTPNPNATPLPDSLPLFLTGLLVMAIIWRQIYRRQTRFT